MGGRVGVGGAAVGVPRGDCKGEFRGESNAAGGVGVLAGVRMPDTVGEVVAVDVPVAVGEAVEVEPGSAGPVDDPGDGEAGPCPIFWPQADRNAANAVAPAPFRKRRRPMESLFFVIPLL